MVKLVIAVAVLAGLVFLASIPVIVVQHVRSVAAERPLNVANGTVVAVEPDASGYLATVEFEARHGDVRRVGIHIEAIGSGPTRRPTFDVGARVLVDFDPANPADARIGGIGPLWAAIVWRAVAGSVSLLVAVAVYVFSRTPRTA